MSDGLLYAMFGIIFTRLAIWEKPPLYSEILYGVTGIGFVCASFWVMFS